MTKPEDKDPLIREVRRHQARRAAWARDGEASVARRLAQIGVLGWIIVAPMLGGIFLGRWLDTRFDTGLFWTAPLLMVGLGLGGWFAWRWMGSA
jgi:ATP synthase protein I